MFLKKNPDTFFLILFEYNTDIWTDCPNNCDNGISVDADEETVAILSALVAENEQWIDLLSGSDYLKDVLLYTEERYRSINDTHQHIDDIYGKEFGIGSFVDLKHNLAIPPEAFSLKIHGFKGNTCNDSHIRLETFAIVPSTTCEQIHHETDTVTVTIVSEAPTKFRVLGPLTSSFEVGPGKRLIPGENYLTTHPLDTLNMTFSSYQGGLWATPNQEGSALVVCGVEIQRGAEGSNRTENAREGVPAWAEIRETSLGITQ